MGNIGYIFGYALFAAFFIGGLTMLLAEKICGKLAKPVEEEEENMEAELAKNVLAVLKMSTHSRTECEALDYAAECIDVRVRLEQFIKEKEL